MSLTIRDKVRVNATIAPRGELRREFGITFFLTTDATLNTGPGRVAVFNDFTAIEAFFPVGSEPYEAGNIYFQQEPFPKNLVVGRWFENAASGQIEGGRAAALASITAVTDGSLQINGEDITTIDFSGHSSYADVAATLQTALQGGTDAGITNATVTFDPTSTSFLVDSVTTGAAITMTVASSAASGTFVGDLLGLSADGGASAFNGVDAETIEEALSAGMSLNSSWYHLTAAENIESTDQNVLDISAWAATQTILYSAGSLEPTVVTTGESSSAFAQLFALQRSRTFGTWSRTGDYKSASASGRLSSWNPDARNSVFTMNGRQLPGTLADDIDSTIKAELDRKRVNYYAPFSTTNIYAEGVTFSPNVFIDVRLFVDWFVNALEVDVFNLLVQSPRVPQTDAGSSAIYTVLESVCQEAIRNGGIAPGQLSPALTLDVQQATGNADFDGFLPKGYLIYIPPYAEQAQANRNAREAQPPRIWVKGSGAIHSIEIGLTFEN